MNNKGEMNYAMLGEYPFTVALSSVRGVTDHYSPFFSLINSVGSSEIPKRQIHTFSYSHRQNKKKSLIDKCLYIYYFWNKETALFILSLFTYASRFCTFLTHFAIQMDRGQKQILARFHSSAFT